MNNIQKNEFLKISEFRNIVNVQEINNTIDSIITNKKLNDYPNIKTWLKNNLKNYFLKKAPIVEYSDLKNLDNNIKDFIITKQIKFPFHLVKIDSVFLDSVNHCIDYLKAEFSTEKDLNRISIDQAKINADNWLKKRLKALTDEEDFEYTVPVLKFEHEGKNYSWVNIASHKGLKRESKLMNHCIESYWKDFYTSEKTDKISPFFSLRDENNKPLVSLFGYISEKKRDSSENKIKDSLAQIYAENSGKDANIDVLFNKLNKINESSFEFLVSEIKEKNNAFLHTYRKMVPYLLNNLHEENLTVFMTELESNESKIYREGLSFISIDEIIDNQTKSFKNTLIMKNTFFNYEEYSNDFPHDKILKALPLYEAMINQDNFSDFAKAIKINVSDLSNQNISLESKHVNISNCENTNINIEDRSLFSKENSEFIFENLNNCNICMNYNKDRYPNNINKFTRTFIFKNCQNVNLIDNHKVEKIILTKDSIINIKQEYSQQEFKQYLNTYFWDYNSKHNEISFINNLDGQKKVMFQNNDSVNGDDKKLANAIQLYMHSEKHDTIFSAFIKTINFNISNIKKSVSFSNFTFEDSIENTIKYIMKDNTFVENLIINNHKHIKDISSNYQQFFNNFNLEIVKNDTSIFNTLLNEDLIYTYNITNYFFDKNKTLLKDIIDNKQDSYVDYFNKFKENKNLLNPLSIYLLKNEILEKVLLTNNKDHLEITNRFSITEERIKQNTSKRWLNFLTDRDYKKTFLNIIDTPYDNNHLLKHILEIEKNQIKAKLKHA